MKPDIQQLIQGFIEAIQHFLTTMYYHAALLPQMDAYFLEQVEYGYIYSVRE